MGWKALNLLTAEQIESTGTSTLHYMPSLFTGENSAPCVCTRIIACVAAFGLWSKIDCSALFKHAGPDHSSLLETFPQFKPSNDPVWSAYSNSGYWSNRQSACFAETSSMGKYLSQISPHPLPIIYCCLSGDIGCIFFLWYKYSAYPRLWLPHKLWLLNEQAQRWFSISETKLN